MTFLCGNIVLYTVPFFLCRRYMASQHLLDADIFNAVTALILLERIHEPPYDGMMEDYFKLKASELSFNGGISLRRSMSTS